MASGDGWSMLNGDALLNGANSIGDAGITRDGGSFTCYVAGTDLAAGQLVGFAPTGNPDTVNKTPTTGNRPIGFVYEAVVAGAIAKVISRGRVAVIGTTTPSKGLVAVVSATVDGTVDGTDTPSATTHFQEAGHFTGATKTVDGVTLYFLDAHFN